MNHENEFENLIKELSEDPRAKQMKNYIQHGKVTTYDHCHRVARLSYNINKLFNIKADKKKLVRGAFLHDYFLYDWHCWNGHLHGFSHAGEACRNAKRDFGLSETEENIIESHMWPLNLFSVPKCREAWVVCLADKICSLQETFSLR